MGAVWAGNRGGRALRTAAAVCEDLVHPVTHPVRRHDATSVLYERGARLLIQLWPGDSLARLAQTAFPGTRATSLRAFPGTHPRARAPEERATQDRTPNPLLA
ncbi:hypothetical protein OG738_26930 [Amycolatopsis sp. NBC_01488]|uniref:hypothetical protein n=1 Tax=Amycolatopsis sp. NBC_01488 TaxID=2903563 RepID=UPI002E2C7EAA|nr:hypothetical protein [Amycolatopsis sp. NBC_01488]